MLDGPPRPHDVQRLIHAAQTGDKQARNQLVELAHERYRGRVARTFQGSRDPALGLADLEQVFIEGVIAAVAVVDPLRGDPLYHLGQRGIWAVLSALRSAASANDVVVRPVRTDDDDPPVFADSGLDFREVIYERLHAQQVVRVVANAPLRSSSRRMLEAMLSGAAGDLSEPGLNQRVATAMGVSPQRASQVRKHLQRDFEAAGA